MSAVRLSIAIQHHPKRSDLLPRLLGELAGSNCFVARDPEPDGNPSPLRCYLEALRLLPDWATHHLILQDDVQVCPCFAIAAARAVEARPESAVCFFVGNQPTESGHRVIRASERDECFVAIEPRRWIPAVALCWPRDLVPAFLAFVSERDWPGMFIADDEALGRFFRANGTEVVATVPSLVEHPDVAPSLIGRRARGGRDRGRVAACYIGDCDALSIDWQ